jgi:hypothetical protein
VEIKFIQIGRENPILLVDPAADGVNLVPVKIFPLDFERGYIPRITGIRIFRIPIARDLGRVLLAQNGVKDRLKFEPWRKGLPIAGHDKIELCLSDRSVQGDDILIAHFVIVRPNPQERKIMNERKRKLVSQSREYLQ